MVETVLTTIDRHLSPSLSPSRSSPLPHTLVASAGREEDNPALLAATTRREEPPNPPVLAAWNGVVEQGRGGLKEETVNPPDWGRMATNKGAGAGDRPPWLPDG